MHTYHLLITFTSLVTAYTMTMENCQRDLAAIKTLQRQYVGTYGWGADTGDQKTEKIKIARECADYKNTQFLVQQKYSQNKYIISDGNDVHIMDMQTGTKEATLTGHTNLIQCCTNTDHRHIIATGSDDTTIKLWNTKNNACLQTLHEHEKSVTNIASEKNTLASIDCNGCFNLWNISSEKPFITRSLINDDNEPRKPLSLMMENNLIYVGFATGHIMIIDPRTTMTICAGTIHENAVVCLTPCQYNGHLFYSGSHDQTIKQWDLRNAGDPTKIIHHDNDQTIANYNIRNVYEDRKGKKIFSSDMDTVYVWDISGDEPTLMTTKNFDYYIIPNCIHMNDDETELYIGTAEGIKTLTPALDFDQLAALVG